MTKQQLINTLLDGQLESAVKAAGTDFLKASFATRKSYYLQGLTSQKDLFNYYDSIIKQFFNHVEDPEIPSYFNYTA